VSHAPEFLCFSGTLQLPSCAPQTCNKLLEEIHNESVRMFAVTALLVAAISATVFAQEMPSVVPLSSSKFTPLPGLPNCLTGAVQHGDPAKGAAVLAARMTAGCTIPWHWHTQSENVIITSGKGKLEMKDEAAHNAGPGDYFYMPSKHQHQFTCLTACTFFNVIDAAFDIHYVDKDGKEIPPEQALKPANKVGAAKEASKSRMQ
jgi:quercetin dioxygenase-like cupin family protein